MNIFRKMIWIIGILALVGCTPKNPAGPSGSGGTGTQTVYNFTVTPAAPQGIYNAACPAVVSNKSSMSTVICSINRSTGLNATLPVDNYAEGGGHTNYYFTFVTGQVNVVWSNDNYYIPPAFNLVVTVANK